MSSLFPIHPSIHPSLLSVWTYGYLSHSLKSNAIIFYFFAGIAPALVSRSSLGLAPVSFHVPYSFLSTLPPSGTRDYKLILNFSVPELTTSPKSPCSYYWRMVFINENLGTRYTCCYWGITASGRAGLCDMSVLTHTCTHISISASVSIKCQSSYWHTSNPSAIPQDSF